MNGAKVLADVFLKGMSRGETSRFMALKTFLV